MGILPPALSLPLVTPSHVYSLPYATHGTAAKISPKDVKGATSEISFSTRACSLDVLGSVVPSFSSLSGHYVPLVIASTERIQSKCHEVRWKVLTLRALSRCLDKCGISGVSIANDVLGICLASINTKVAPLTQVGLQSISFPHISFILGFS